MATLLIVDRDADLGDSLREVLVDEGHEVHLVPAILEGGTPLPDLVLLDVRPPILHESGEALRAMLEDAGLVDVPIILLSAFRELPGFAAALGTPGFLVKPFRLEELLRLVRRALEGGGD